MSRLYSSIAVNSYLVVASEFAKILDVQVFLLIGKALPSGSHWLEKQRPTLKVQDETQALWASTTGYAVLAMPGNDLYIIDCDSAMFQARLYIDLPTLQERCRAGYRGAEINFRQVLIHCVCGHSREIF